MMTITVSGNVTLFVQVRHLSRWTGTYLIADHEQNSAIVWIIATPSQPCRRASPKSTVGLLVLRPSAPSGHNGGRKLAVRQRGSDAAMQRSWQCGSEAATFEFSVQPH